MADENLQDESLENWWEQHEPRELAGIALKPFAPHRGPAPQSPLSPAADEQKDDSKPGPGNEPHSQVAADRSIGMDGFGVALDRLSYFASERLSENINRSPEGFLIYRLRHRPNGIPKVPRLRAQRPGRIARRPPRRRRS